MNTPAFRFTESTLGANRYLFKNPIKRTLNCLCLLWITDKKAKQTKLDIIVENIFYKSVEMGREARLLILVVSLISTTYNEIK